MFRSTVQAAMVAGLSMCLVTDSARGVVLDFAAELTGDCAGSGSSNNGWATLSLDADTGILTYSVAYDTAVTPVFAHIHFFPSACGNVPSGPIIVSFTVANPIVGSSTLSSLDMEHVFQNATYVNLHTPAFPNGEIAGVLYPVPTNRYLSIMPATMTAPSAAATQAIRVTLVSLHHPDPPTPGSPDFTASEGQFRWIGAPEVLNDGGGPNATYTRAALQCAPEFRDWSDVPFLMHAMGSDAVPSSVYAIQYVDDTCADLNDPLCYSDPIVVENSRYGDVIAPFAEFVGGGQPDFADISQLVSKFQVESIALILPRVDLRGPSAPGLPNIPDGEADFLDIGAAVDAFQSGPYPFGPGPSCP